MSWPNKELFFSASHCPTLSCKLCLLQLCTVLQITKGQRQSLSTPVWFSCRCWHSFHWETATLRFDYCTPDIQWVTVPPQVHHQPPGSCRCSSRCRGCPRCARPAGRPRWHWPGTADTREDTWAGAGPWHSFPFIPLQPTPHVWLLWSMLMLHCHHHRHCTVNQCQPS